MLESLLANDLYSALFAFALVLVPAIIVHEIGHYLAARAVGIRILEFGIGIPPRLTRLFRWRGTDFTLNWLPFGGFVRPLGEDLVRPLDEEESVKQHAIWDADLDTDGQAVHEAKPWARIVFFIGGSAANLISAYLLLILSALLGVMQPISATLEVIEAGAASAVRAGDRIVALNGEPISESVELFAALAADGNLSFTIERTDGSRQSVTLETNSDSRAVIEAQALVLDVEPGSPAARAGIRAGDRVVAVDGNALGQDGGEPISKLSALTTARRGQEIQLELRRETESVTLSLIPRVEVGPNQGAMGIVIRAAYEYAPLALVLAKGPFLYERQAISLPAAIEYASTLSGYLLRSILSLPVELLRGAIPAEYARPVSIVGISQLGGQQIKASVSEGNPAGMLEFAAFISIALGITNLLPLPALDGGRIVFVLLELLRGKPLAPQHEGAIHLIGFVLLLTLGLLVIANDIVNPITSMLAP